MIIKSNYNIDINQFNRIEGTNIPICCPHSPLYNENSIVAPTPDLLDPSHLSQDGNNRLPRRIMFKFLACAFAEFLFRDEEASARFGLFVVGVSENLVPLRFGERFRGQGEEVVFGGE